MRDYIFRFSQSIYLEKTSRRGFAALCIAIIIQSSLVWTVIVISAYSSITQTHLERFPAKASKSGFIEIISCFDYILPSPNKLGNTNHKDVNNASSSSSIWLLNAFVWVYNTQYTTFIFTYYIAVIAYWSRNERSCSMIDDCKKCFHDSSRKMGLELNCLYSTRNWRQRQKHFRE